MLRAGGGVLAANQVEAARGQRTIACGRRPPRPPRRPGAAQGRGGVAALALWRARARTPPPSDAVDGPAAVRLPGVARAPQGSSAWRGTSSPRHDGPPGHAASSARHGPATHAARLRDARWAHAAGHGALFPAAPAPWLCPRRSQPRTLCTPAAWSAEAAASTWQAPSLSTI